MFKSTKEKEVVLSPEGQELLEKIKKTALKPIKGLKVVAISDGYYADSGNHDNARIIKSGEVFVFNHNLKNGRLPLWVRPVDIKEAKKAGVTDLNGADESEDLV